MTLDEEIAWWTNVMHRYSNEIGFVALGMATGLKLAKADYGAKDNDTVLAPESPICPRQNPFERNARRMSWQPIETIPKDGQALVTDWKPGDPWACTIELVNLPFLEDGRVLNQNSANYTQPGVWKWWMPVPPAPHSPQE